MPEEEVPADRPVIPSQGEQKFVAGEADIEADVAEENIEGQAEVEVNVDVAEESIEVDVAERDEILEEKLPPTLESQPDRSSSADLEVGANGAIAVGNSYQATAQGLAWAALNAIQAQQQLNTSARAATGNDLRSIYKIFPRAAATSTSGAIAKDRALEIQRIAKVLVEIFKTC